MLVTIDRSFVVVAAVRIRIFVESLLFCCRTLFIVFLSLTHSHSVVHTLFLYLSIYLAPSLSHYHIISLEMMLACVKSNNDILLHYFICIFFFALLVSTFLSLSFSLLSFSTFHCIVYFFMVRVLSCPCYIWLMKIFHINSKYVEHKKSLFIYFSARAQTHTHSVAC